MRPLPFHAHLPTRFCRPGFFLTAIWLISALLSNPAVGRAADQLERGFSQPPAEARPWVYWFWLNGNISSNGITRDLESMKRVGIGGVLIMEVDQGAPVGPVDFMSTRWRNLFQHVVAESRRLGLEVNMNNDAGWNGSGGPWIQPELSMQKVVWTETAVTGTKRFEGVLPTPETVAGYYRDLQVLAIPKVGDFRIDRIRAKAMFEVGHVGGVSRNTVGAEMIVDRKKIVDVSSKTDAAGKLVWEVPAGEWTILRFGHTSTGVENAPAPKSGRGLECDKLSREGIEANFAAMMARLVADTPQKSKPALVASHIDSWENGSQNWTKRMREEFQARRGYDLFPFFPVLTGRVVDSLEVSERFLWDLRQTVSELVLENYAGHFRNLAHAAGLRFTVEAYGSPCDFIPFGGASDEPMGEFWSPSGAMETCKGMAGAAHVYGKRIVGAEAFTAADQEKWREHPALIKALGDRAFCEGINRFVFHRFALQPWKEERRPGMTMGPWGQHYEWTQTWWEDTPSWHQYLARCQFLLRQGRFAADICYLQSEMAPQGFADHPRRGYDWDECGSEVVLSRMTVADGRITLPDGMTYRALVLPGTDSMTPRLLGRIGDLVREGATVIGSPPRYAPGLAGFPQCDEEVRSLANAIWGDLDGKSKLERPLGKGRVVWTTSPEEYLGKRGIEPDFVSGQPLRFIHRVTEDTDIYFVANPGPRHVSTTASFRVSGRTPELWWPETGRREHASVWQTGGQVTTIPLTLEPSGSVFVVFRSAGSTPEALLAVRHNGKEVISAVPSPAVRVQVEQAIYGVPGDSQRTRDVREKVQRKVDAGEYSFPVLTMAEGDDPAANVLKTLKVDYRIEEKSYSVQATDPQTIHITPTAVKVVVEKARYGILDDPGRTRDVREKLQRLVDAGESSFQVARMAEGDDPAFLVVKTLEVDYSRNGERTSISARDPDTIDLAAPMADRFERVAELRSEGPGETALLLYQPGAYEIERASGKRAQFRVDSLPAPLTLKEPWEVRFATNWGGPPRSTFPELISWSRHSDNRIRFFSGHASYTTRFSVPRAMMGKGLRVFLDLGRVEVMAAVALNGKNLGLLWKSPFRYDISETVRTGENRLEVRVVNLWPNRLMGDEQLPEDSERNPDGTLKKWPDWLEAGKPSPSGRFTFTSWRLWRKNDALLDSGLLGPVTVTAAREVPVRRFK
jgi:hypothetical protein